MGVAPDLLVSPLLAWNLHPSRKLGHGQSGPQFLASVRKTPTVPKEEFRAVSEGYREGGTPGLLCPSAWDRALVTRLDGVMRNKGRLSPWRRNHSPPLGTRETVSPGLLGSTCLE